MCRYVVELPLGTHVSNLHYCELLGGPLRFRVRGVSAVRRPVTDPSVDLGDEGLVGGSQTDRGVELGSAEKSTMSEVRVRARERGRSEGSCVRLRTLDRMSFRVVRSRISIGLEHCPVGVRPHSQFMVICPWLRMSIYQPGSYAAATSLSESDPCTLSLLRIDWFWN